MIAVVSTSDGKVDFVIQTSIHYGLVRAGGPVVRFSDRTDFSKATKLCIVGHGSPGSIENYSAEQVADILTDPVLGVNQDLEMLLLTSCYAGLPVNGQKGTAVIDVIARALKTKKNVRGVEIKGAMGPSIKANALGDVFRVVPKKGTPEYTRAGKAQGDLTSSFDYEFLADMTLTNPSPAQLETAANFAGEVTFQFYKDFVGRLEKERDLLPGTEAMRTLII